MYKYPSNYTYLAIGLIFFSMFGFIIFNIFPSIDIILANYFFKNNQFYLKHNWWLETFMHIYIKYLIIICILAQYIYFFIKKYKNSIIIASVLTLLLIVFCITGLKQISTHACPWDLYIYGGDKPWVLWWSNNANNISNGVQTLGKCFPAGHSTSGLCIMALGIVFYAHKQYKLAYSMYILGIIAGLVLGIVQQIRGAHFLSHTLASICIACFITFIMQFLVDKFR